MATLNSDQAFRLEQVISKLAGLPDNVLAGSIKATSDGRVTATFYVDPATLNAAVQEAINGPSN